jgi:hypothetical protein
MLGAVAKYTLRSYAAALVEKYGAGSLQVRKWNALSAGQRRAMVDGENVARKQAAKKAANRAPKKEREPSGSQDAYTRQGRMSEDDWNQLFHA